MSFESDYLKDYSEKEEEITVLIKSGVLGAVVENGYKFPDTKFFAYIDSDGNLVEEEGILEWFLKEDEEGVKYSFSQFGIYKVKVRRIKENGTYFYLVGILDENATNDELEKIKAERMNPIFLENKYGKFNFDFELNWFDNKIEIDGNKIHIAINIEEKNEEAEKICKKLEEYLDNFQENDKANREYAAKELIETAKDWAEEELIDLDDYIDDYLYGEKEEKVEAFKEKWKDSDEATEEIWQKRWETGENTEDKGLTESSFAKRIKIESIDIYDDGSLELFYNDDDIFYGHVIVIKIESDGTFSNCDIAG